MLSRIYFFTGIAVIAFYVLAVVNGWELGQPARQYVPASVRNSPGGYRSFHFWHSGFRGGK